MKEKSKERKKTFAEILNEVEQAVQPLGFEIENVSQFEGHNFFNSEDKGKLKISLIRYGKAG